ncbi:MAG: hypothetical protein M1813_001337 [Trichoglossum hirsutum]|nr:MAG: hypothetical protein M1813_001337 [Trichoglossum hirsutum]
MASLSKSEILQSKPIGEGLNAFRDLYNTTRTDLPELSDAVGHMHIGDEGLKELVLDLILALQGLPAARLLRSPNGRDTLRTHLLRFTPLVDSGDFDIRSAIPLLNKVLSGAPDADIWGGVYSLVTESTPPPRPLPYLDRTPISFNTGSLANTSEYRKYFDDALKDELDSSLYIDISSLFDTFFEGENPLYKGGEGGGWRGWPEDASEKDVLKWFKERVDTFLEFAKESATAPSVQRRSLGQPSQHLSGSTPKRKLDIGFANGTKTSESFRYDWSQILVPGELKSNPKADRQRDTWLDLARYARHVLTAQDTRRFVLGFTLCGSIMRLWEFDRLGGIASSPFDINKEGLQFVSAVLGYLWVNEEQLGFDPTIFELDGKRYMEITRNSKTERLVLVELMKRHSSVAGRATTCWKAYRDGDKSNMTLVIKDSWQYTEREEEGEFLRGATEKGWSTWRDITIMRRNVRKGLGITKASNAFRHISVIGKTEGMMPAQSTSGALVGARSGRSRSTARKRSSSSLNTPLPLPPNKRSCSTSPHEDRGCSELPNRIHRRVILRDYGKNIYKASSRVAMLAALEGNITVGHESLRDLTGIIQSDVSIGNPTMNEEEDNPSWQSFLIDLDLAIKERREKPSGARSKTGTRAFIAIGALLSEKHSFMHDLESFF